MNITISTVKTNTSKRTENVVTLADHFFAYVGLDVKKAKRAARMNRAPHTHVETQRKLVTGSRSIYHYTVIVTERS